MTVFTSKPTPGANALSLKGDKISPQFIDSAMLQFKF